MKSQSAAALVAAGMVSVLAYPIIGLRRLGGSPKSAQPTVSPEHSTDEGG